MVPLNQHLCVPWKQAGNAAPRAEKSLSLELIYDPLFAGTEPVWEESLCLSHSGFSQPKTEEGCKEALLGADLG